MLSPKTTGDTNNENVALYLRLVLFAIAVIAPLALLQHQAAPDIAAAQQALRDLRIVEMLPNEHPGSHQVTQFSPLPGWWQAETTYADASVRMTWLAPVLAQGYAGEIRLRVALDHAGALRALGLISHQETPGLGDIVERRHSDWLLQFQDNRAGPSVERFRLRADGGEIDGISGATVTTRAIADAVAEAMSRLPRQLDAARRGAGP